LFDFNVLVLLPAALRAAKAAGI